MRNHRDIDGRGPGVDQAGEPEGVVGDGWVGAADMPDDNSRNSSLLGLLVWGEGWHNNHHAFPSSAAFGLKRREIDFGYWLIRLLEKLGLAWDVKSPSTAHIARRRERLQSLDQFKS